MRMNAPLESQIPALRSLWLESFDDTNAFLDTFFHTAFSPERCRLATVDGNVAGALYWFDCLHTDKRIAYLYAVATAKSFRRQGICHKLMEHTHRLLTTLGYEGAVLVPGNPSLFRLYESMGYQLCGTIREFSCTGTKGDISFSLIDKIEYAKLRRQFLPEGGVIQEQENLDFLQTQAQFYAGTNFLLTARREGDTLYGIELLGDETIAPNIVSALGYTKGFFRVPGTNIPFAMYRPLLLQNEAPKTEQNIPTYFGLAFD